MKLTVASSPHIRGDFKTSRLMLDVVIALLPALAPLGREEGRRQELDLQGSPTPHTLYRPEGRN